MTAVAQRMNGMTEFEFELYSEVRNPLPASSVSVTVAPASPSESVEPTAGYTWPQINRNVAPTWV
jgi:hypothetical protein